MTPGTSSGTLGPADKAVPVFVYPHAAALGESLAEKIVIGVDAAAKMGEAYLLGCPGGRSAASTYEAIGRLAAEKQVSMANLVVVMMDNYVERVDGGFRHCPHDAHYSCMRFARADIRDVVNSRLGEDHRIPDASIWMPDPAEPDAYESQIDSAGGIDLFIVASGASDGHVAFNPPGSDLESTTRITELAQTTRQDNLGTFPEFGGIDEVPTHGVTVGVGTIVSCSREVVCVIHGAHKQRAVRELAARKSYDPQWPASLVYEANTVGLLVDEAAAVGLGG